MKNKWNKIYNNLVIKYQQKIINLYYKFIFFNKKNQRLLITKNINKNFNYKKLIFFLLYFFNKTKLLYRSFKKWTFF